MLDLSTSFAFAAAHLLGSASPVFVAAFCCSASVLTLAILYSGASDAACRVLASSSVSTSMVEAVFVFETGCRLCFIPCAVLDWSAVPPSWTPSTHDQRCWAAIRRGADASHDRPVLCTPHRPNTVLRIGRGTNQLVKQGKALTASTILTNIRPYSECQHLVLSSFSRSTLFTNYKVAADWLLTLRDLQHLFTYTEVLPKPLDLLALLATMKQHGGSGLTALGYTTIVETS